MTRSTSLDRLRADRTELENHLIDEHRAGRLSRRELLARGSVIGLSLPAISSILAACGDTQHAAAGRSDLTSTRGGTLRVAVPAPTASVNPLSVDDSGGIAMLNQTGEFLIFDSSLKLQLQPMLALRWSPNAHGDRWRFRLRHGVRFHHGKAMTADDVVYTFRQLADTKNASNALSTFAGVLSPDGVVKVDTYTVDFHLDSPNGNFPYLVSSDNYNAIIVPAGTDFGTWQQTFIGTGAFKLGSYQQNASASFVPNPDYWGGKPLLDGTTFQFYEGQQPQVLALQGGQVDVIAQFVPAGATALLNNSSYTIIKARSANHRELSMRTDQAPFTDPQVRQAVALTLDRPGMVSALLDGLGTVANDYPFGPRFRSTDTSVPQRTQNIARAKQLLSAAGHDSGISTTLYSEVFEEVPLLAQSIKAEAAKANININLRIETSSAYYGKATFGNSDWLDGTMSLVDYADRGVPNVFLEAALTTHGPWNAGHFNNSTYDTLVRQYVAALDLQTQRTIAGKIERVLLQETPIIIPYWIENLTATTTSVGGTNPTSSGQIYLNKAYKDS